MISCDKAISGIIALILSTNAMYSSRVCWRFISLRILVLPLCTGKWIYLQTLWCLAITRITSSCISCGLDVEKRKRIFGDAVAHISNNWAKSTAVAFCISLARSEERRVGIEGRRRGAAAHYSPSFCWGAEVAAQR